MELNYKEMNENDLLSASRKISLRLNALKEKIVNKNYYLNDRI
jgi:hypothetical protein